MILHHIEKGLSGEGTEQERFANSGSVWAGISRSFQCYVLDVPQQAGVVPRRRNAAIRTVIDTIIVLKLPKVVSLHFFSCADFSP